MTIIIIAITLIMSISSPLIVHILYAVQYVNFTLKILSTYELIYWVHIYMIKNTAHIKKYRHYMKFNI